MRPGRLRVRHALDPMDAGFEFELGEGAAAADLGDDLLVATLGALAGGEQFRFPAMGRRIALVHSVEVAGEQRRLVAAGAGPDFEDHVAIVHRVLGDQGQPDVVLQGVARLFQSHALLAGDGAHLRIGRGIGDDEVEVGDLGGSTAVGFHLCHHGRDLGEFAGELHIGFRRQLAGEFGLQRRMTRQHDVELGLGKHE